jgi:hypothetical protein
MTRRTAERSALWRVALLLAALCAPPARPASAAPSAAEVSRATGFENVSVRGGDDTLQVAFENRRYRHSAQAFGVLAAVTGERATWVERRLGLEMAGVRRVPAGAPGWIERTFGAPADSSFQARYPSDDPFWPALRGAPERPTTRTIDLTVGPRLRYEFGRVLDPFLFSLDLEPRVRYVPWTGARATASVLVPLHNDFERTDLQPDIGRLRPGSMGVEQFFWMPGLALGSLHAGYFGENRYGGSLGFARPVADGRWLLDAQMDLTGFVSFTQGEILYSNPTLRTGFAGLTWHAPVFDLSLRGRAQWYLFGDRGVELQIRREIGDLGVAFYYQRIEGDGIEGVRLDIPVPPAVRGTGSAVRVQPVERFPFSYDDRGRAIGSALSGTASREALLAQLDEPALDANRDRYRRGLTGAPAPAREADPGWVSLSGMTGLATTPWAGSIGDRMVEVGYTYVPKKWAFDSRNLHPNAYYYGTVGFLPFLEVQLRWTHIVGRRDFEEIVPDSRLADLDRTASARLVLLEPAQGRPGLAIGMDDLVGTRRFHSTYAVAGLPARIFQMHARAAIGYAPTAFAAPRHVLDGAFGGFEMQPWRALRLQVEHDSEKWIAGLGLEPGFGFRIRVAALGLESLSAGAGWSWPL